MNIKIKTFMLFTLFSVFQYQLLFASSSTLGTQNTFGASASGHSTENDQNSKLVREHQQDLQKLDVRQQLESKDNLQTQKQTPLNHLVNSYQRSIELFISKGLLTTEILNTAIKDKNIYFENIRSLSMDLNANIFLQNLAVLKKNVLTLYIENEFEVLALEFLESESKKQLEVTQVTEDIRAETQNIFYPHIISTQDLKNYFTDTRDIQYDIYNNQEGDLIAVLTGSESRFIYQFNVTKNEFIRAIDMNHIAGKSLNTLQLLPALLLKFDHKSHVLTKTKDGKDILIFETSSPRVFFIDLSTGLEVHKSLFINDSHTYSKFHPETYTLENDIRAVIFESSGKLKFMNIDTGQFVTKENSISIFGKKISYAKKTKIIKTPYNFSNHKTVTTLENGEKIVILAYENEIIFLDPYHSQEKHPRFQLPEDSTLKAFFITTIGPRKYLYINTTRAIGWLSIRSYNYLVDIETGILLPESKTTLSKQEILLNTENFNSELNFHISAEFNSQNSTLYFTDLLGGEPVIEPLEIPKDSADTQDENIHLSFLFKNQQSDLILVLYTNNDIYFINVKKREILFSVKIEYLSNESLSQLEKHIIKTYKNETLLLGNNAYDLLFYSTSNGTEAFTPLTNKDDINNYFVFTDPKSGQEFVFFTTNMIQMLSLVSLNSTSKTISPPIEGSP